MKFFRSVTVTPEHCPQELYNRILQLKPEAQRGSIFHLEARPGDEASARLVERVAALCREQGLDKVRGAYSHLVLPHYEASDLEASPLLWLLTQKRMFKGINSNRRDECGRIVLPAAEAKQTIRIASIFPEPWLVVSTETRRLLENGGLDGIKFDEVALKGHSIHSSPEPFWELRSTVVLPRMVNSVIDTTVDWHPERYLVQDPYGEPHYRRSELEPLGAFDIAHTFERLSSGSPGLIVSQRFYRHCLTNQIPLEVRPARIDPD